MTGLEKQITALELRLNRRPDVKTAVGLTLRCWWAHKNASALAEMPADTYMHKAYHTVTFALRKNESHLRLFMLAIFIAIEADRFDNANEMLDKAMSCRNFLRANEPLYYAVLRFLYAYLEIRQKRARSARKHIRALEEFIHAAPTDPRYDLMLGMLSLSFYEYEKAYEYLADAYKSGCRSVFLYQSLYIYYRTAMNAPSGPTLLPVLHWAAAHQADVADIIRIYPDELRTALLKDPKMGEAIYENAPNPFVLRGICAARMMAADFGPQAYRYYREAERRQISLKGLYTFLVKAAHANQSERIHHFAMTEFLRTAESHSNPMETGLAVYVYHLLLTDPLLADLIAARKNNILQLATHCLENNQTGRQENSLYAYYWEQCKIMGVSGVLTDKAEEILYSDLTRFEVQFSSEVKQFYVTEPEKKGMTAYEIQEPVTYINAVGEEINFTCLSSGRKSILSEQPTVRRMVNHAGFSLYRHFFRKGARGFYLLAYLANYFLLWLDETEEITGTVEYDEAIQVFEALLEDDKGNSCAKPYRMRILAALGKLHYAAGHFAKALTQYGAMDESELDDKYLEQILHVFLQTHEWPRAIGLLARRGLRMERQKLFEAIEYLSGKEIQNLAGVAYELLIDGCYSQDLLALVLTNFTGSRDEWNALSQALDSLGITEPRLDEIIVKNSLWSFRWDTAAQHAFVRLCSHAAPASGLLSRFLEYSEYEMLVNGSRPEYEMLTLLENAYLEKKDEVLAWALCHVYLGHKVSTFNSEQILSEALQSQEESDILFPVFHENRGVATSPYAEKNCPFLYHGLPGKDVYLYYRVDDTQAFSARPMRYFRFGIYLTTLPLFYNESLTYYFSEEMPTGSITTKESQVKNGSIYLHEPPGDDLFFTLNNAIIYEQMFKYEQVEAIITGLVRDVNPVRSTLL